jgi:hypothetical protein
MAPEILQRKARSRFSSQIIRGQTILCRQAMGLVTGILTHQSFHLKSSAVFELDFEQTIVDEAIEPFYAAIAPGFM